VTYSIFVAKNRVIKRLLADFEVMRYNQHELNFDGG
jgi:hypothetical protein